jgi:Flp pilus assembly pilin Flp
MKPFQETGLRAYVRLFENSRAQGYTEYTILLALIAIAAYAAVQLLGTNVSTAINGVAGSV